MSGETNLQSFEQDMIRKPASTKGNVEGEVAMSRMLKRLHKNRFYVKHGPQGDGKSSCVMFKDGTLTPASLRTKGARHQVDQY